MRNPSYKYEGPPPVSLAVQLEDLAKEVRCVSEEDADLALELAKEVREEAKNAEAEKRRVAEMEKEKSAKEAARKAEAAAREAEARILAREKAKREEEEAKRRHLDDNSEADGGGGMEDFIVRRKRATEAAANLPTLFEFGDLPDEVAGAVLRRMGDYEVAAMSTASRRFNRLAATDDALWRGLQLRARRYPGWRIVSDADNGGQATWKESFLAGTAVDAQWRRMRFQKKDHRAHSEYAQCVAMMGDVGVSGSADHTLAVIGLPPRGRPEPPTPRAGGWERTLARCNGHNEPVTCCRLFKAGVGGSSGWDADDHDVAAAAAAAVPSTLVSSTAGGELRVWDLRGLDLDPWSEEDEDERVGGGAADIQRVECVAAKQLTTPGTGQPHSQFFDISGGGGSQAGGSLLAGSLLACAGDAAGAGVHVYDTERWGSAIRRMPGFDAAVYGVSFDDNVIHAACSDGVVRRWDVRSPAPADVHAKTNSSSSSSSSSSAVVSAAVSALGPMDASTGLSRRSAARCVAADDGLFAFGSAAGTLHVHDSRKPSQPVAPPRRVHSDCINCVSMDARLRRVVTGGDDCGIAVTRLPLGALSLAGDPLVNPSSSAPPAFLSTPQGVLSVAFDHSRMIAGCEDSTVRVWDAVLGEGYVDRDALKLAMSMLNRRFRGTGSMPSVQQQPDQQATT